MRVLSLEQGTAPWFRWRQQGVGAIDLTVLMGMGTAIDPRSPPTVEELLAEKLGTGQRQDNFAMRRGRRLESPALRLLCQREDLVLRPACVEHDEQPWMHASLDGLSFLGDVIAEIKACKALYHEQALAGMVPLCYRPQVQWQLLVTELPGGLYVSYSEAVRFGGPDSPSLAVVEVQADAELQAQLIEAASRFWAKVQQLRAREQVA